MPQQTLKQPAGHTPKTSQPISAQVTSEAPQSVFGQVGVKTPIKKVAAPRKDIGLMSVVSLGIGSIIGAGIFALLGQVISLAGEYTYYSFIIAGLIAMLCGYSYAKLSAVYPGGGGLTDYFQKAFPRKEVFGTLALIYFVTSVISVAMMAKSFGIYMNHLFPSFLTPEMSVNFFAVLIIVSLGLLNMRQATDVGWTETALVTVKVGILALLIAAAFAHFDTRLVQTYPIDLTWGRFFRSIGVTFFAYAGFGIVTNAARVVAHPRTTISRALYLTLLIVILLYMGLTFVVMNFMPFEHISGNMDTAVVSVAQKLLGSWGYGLIYLAAIIAFMSGISATFFSTFRISKALAEQGVMPRIYKKPFWQNGTMGNALSVFLVALGTVLFNFNEIVNVASGAYLISYLGIFMSNWVLREKTKSSPFLILAGFFLMSAVFIGFIYSFFS